MDKLSHPNTGLRSGIAAGTDEPEKSTSPLILTINGGSSSLKFALFEWINLLPRLLTGRVDRIGMTESNWEVKWFDSKPVESRKVTVPDPIAAIRLLIEWLEKTIGVRRIKAIGHRIVHGGRNYHQPQIVTPAMIEELRAISPCDPEHLPGEIELINAFCSVFPRLNQVACFDTAFHHNMPRVAQIVPIPRRFESVGVRRYGFHGLSYEYLMEELARIAQPDEARGRIILAHLGAGSSLAAVRDHHSIDTTMGFTPASGLVMGTRTGDFDPGLVRFLQETEKMSPKNFDTMINHESGLMGVSETSSDVRDLLSRQLIDVRAAEAIDLFCYQVRKGIGAFAAALGGLDTLVFTGGIGENSPEIRRRICEELEFLGITLVERQNSVNSLLISASEKHVKVRVIPTNEELMIAKSVARTLISKSIQ